MAYSRRNFILASGSLALLGSTLTSSKAAAEPAKNTDHSNSQYVLIHDENLCIGCNECINACNTLNLVPEGYARLSIIPIPAKEGEKTPLSPEEQRFFRHSCQQCEDAPCIDVCPTKASYRDSHGVVQVDKSLCIGCNHCIAACPYQLRYINPITHIADKCNFCSDTRLEKDFMPVCVRICPGHALYFGPEDSEEIQAVLNAQPHYVHQLKGLGKPKIYRLTLL